ncbi:MAG: GyrI-like domain-containing protein [Actinomycetota bacterium]
MHHFAPEIVDLDPEEAIAVHGDVALEDLPGFFERAFADAAAGAQAAGVEIIGPPFGYYPATDGDVVAVEAGFPVTALVGETDSTHPLILPGGAAVVVTHVGPYEALADTYDELQAWMADNDLRAADNMWESYVAGPGTEPDPTKWRTKITWPLAEPTTDRDGVGQLRPSP